MKFYTTPYFSTVYLFNRDDIIRFGNPRSNRSTDEEKKHLFPGTGFLFKNRSPYENDEAKQWFLDALELQKTDEIQML